MCQMVFGLLFLNTSDRGSSESPPELRHLRWNYPPYLSATLSQKIIDGSKCLNQITSSDRAEKIFSNYLLWLSVVVLLAEKAHNLIELHQLLQSQLLVLPKRAKNYSSTTFSSFPLECGVELNGIGQLFLCFCLDLGLLIAMHRDIWSTGAWHQPLLGIDKRELTSNKLTKYLL